MSRWAERDIRRLRSRIEHALTHRGDLTDWQIAYLKRQVMGWLLDEDLELPWHWHEDLRELLEILDSIPEEAA